MAAEEGGGVLKGANRVATALATGLLVAVTCLVSAAFAIVTPMLTDSCGAVNEGSLLCNGTFIGGLMVFGLFGPLLIGGGLWLVGLLRGRSGLQWLSVLAAMAAVGLWVGLVFLLA